MTGTPCPAGRQLAGLALHALEPDEELAVLAHLRTCTRCASDLQADHEVLATLATTGPRADPPSDLRSRILAAARTSATTPSHAARLTPPHSITWSTRTEPTDPEHHRTGAASPRHGRRPTTRTRLLTALAAVACVVAVGGLAGQAANLQAQQTAQQSQARTLAGIVTGLDAPGNVHATLLDGHGTPVGAVVSGAGGLHVVTADLPTNDHDDVYVLWALADTGSPRAIGTFDATAGRTDVVSLPSTGSAPAGYAVSLEPGRVAPATPGTVLASGRIS